MSLNTLPTWAKTDDIVYDFWKHYLKSDILIREDLIQHTGLMQELIRMRTDKKVTNKLFKHVLVMTIQGFIDDLATTLPTITKPTQTIITDARLKEVLKPKALKEFNKWMRGQTCMLDSVYVWDFERWILGLEPFW